MAERVLRGSRLGAVSYETDRTAEMAPRQAVRYSCPDGHRFAVPLAEEADVPATWECRVCGETALRVDGNQPEPKKVKPARTHWDMLMERRTVSELEQLLEERLTVLRASRTTPPRRKSA
jgi:rubredoxin